jgi:N-acetylglutamate synthase-like GNAT family acetyltransferase
MINLDVFQSKDQEELKAFVLHIQNNEFGLDFSETDQPDLLDTKSFYKNGGFWTAKLQDQLVGTIGLQKLDDSNAVLRKMFLKKEVRGSQLNIAQKLVDTLLDCAKKKDFKTIWLDTPAVATASHRFYERNGFVETDHQNLPKGYQFIDKNSKIYKLILA